MQSNRSLKENNKPTLHDRHNRIEKLKMHTSKKVLNLQSSIDSTQNTSRPGELRIEESLWQTTVSDELLQPSQVLEASYT